MKFDFSEFLRRLLKYAAEGIAVALAVYIVLRNKKPNMNEILVIALSAAAMFALLDLFSPSISSAARSGTGFGLGAGLVGFPGAMM